VAESCEWGEEGAPGNWVKVARRFRDGHTEDWWALEVECGPYGLKKAHRAVVVTTDPESLPKHTTWYLTTNLLAPGSERAQAEGALPAADIAEVVRLYGLRMWVEQGYKQVKNTLGWAQYQVRSDLAMRRHWQLVCLAFSFCWWQESHYPRQAAPLEGDVAAHPGETRSDVPDPATSEVAGRGENGGQTVDVPTAAVLAGGTAAGTVVAGVVGNAVAILARVVQRAPAAAVTTAA